MITHNIVAITLSGVIVILIGSAAIAADRPADRVKVEPAGEGRITVKIDGKLFTAFNYTKGEPKPFLYPVIGPTDEPVTRDYPMKDTASEKDNKRQDHPHHRSIWCAHGDVRTKDFDKPGSNYWHQAKDKAEQDYQIAKRIVRTASGPKFGEIEAEIEWTNAAGVREFTEYRTYRFYAGDKDSRIIDTRNVFKFTDTDVMFANTKEAGIMAVRLAVTMDESGVKEPEKLSGQMTNAKGQVGMKDCWGKPAVWCDYYGPVGGKTVGVAIFDHPKNFRHPARWHIRDYGLYTANPFGEGYFQDDKSQKTAKTYKKGESAEFNYRILIHVGDTEAADVAGQWQIYSTSSAVKNK